MFFTEQLWVTASVFCIVVSINSSIKEQDKDNSQSHLLDDKIGYMLVLETDAYIKSRFVSINGTAVF